MSTDIKFGPIYIHVSEAVCQRNFSISTVTLNFLQFKYPLDELLGKPIHFL